MVEDVKRGSDAQNDVDLFRLWRGLARLLRLRLLLQ